MSVVTHGDTKGRELTTEYRAWCKMKERCYNQRNNQYPNYGGRGIRVCDRWRDSFAAFLEDMGRKPSKSHSMDRIDSDGDYGPDNCRWADHITQQNNRRNNRLFEIDGRTQSLTVWCREYGVPFGRVRSRLTYGWSIKPALVAPLGSTRQAAEALCIAPTTTEADQQGIGE